MTDFVKMRELIRQEERYRWAVEKQMAKATKITSTLSKSGRSGSGRTGSQVEDGAVELAPLKEEYTEIKEELDAMRAELCGRSFASAYRNSGRRAIAWTRPVSG